ncbi:hypothetical protein CY0110_15922 [Crocosphaera chwakensis CCY0110]|uniref:Uncharacterized protein n=1 Tax=Crocosphaera chwakensis CCY0110 TaxID=391612 RepID=A3IHL6_9CHRO|nr:hypothetical protein CY0110_15922 [Crocosphaera chwakensis CCY0110]
MPCFIALAHIRCWKSNQRPNFGRLIRQNITSNSIR